MTELGRTHWPRSRTTPVPPSEGEAKTPGAQRADDPADAVHAEHIERIVVTEHFLQTGNRPQADDAGDAPSTIAPIGPT